MATPLLPAGRTILHDGALSHEEKRRRLLALLAYLNHQIATAYLRGDDHLARFFVDLRRTAELAYREFQG